MARFWWFYENGWIMVRCYKTVSIHFMIYVGFCLIFQRYDECFSKIWRTFKFSTKQNFASSIFSILLTILSKFMSFGWCKLGPFYRWNEETKSEPIAPPPFLMLTRGNAMNLLSSWWSNMAQKVVAMVVKLKQLDQIAEGSGLRESSFSC